MKKTIQYFSEDYLKNCQHFQPKQILEFLDHFKKLQNKNLASFSPSSSSSHSPSKLISIKIPEDLLSAFKLQATARGIRYQTQIKILMREWIVSSSVTKKSTRQTK